MKKIIANIIGLLIISLFLIGCGEPLAGEAGRLKAKPL